MVKLNIPGLHGGLSQQEPLLRLDNQLEKAHNCVCDLEKGLSFPRYPTDKHLVIANTNNEDRYEKIITSDNKEWLLKFDISSNRLLIYPMDGGAHITVSGSQLDYLDLPNVDLEHSIVVRQMLDYTFILNKEKIVKETPVPQAVAFFGTNSIGLVTIKQVVNTIHVGVSINITLNKDFGSYHKGDRIEGWSSVTVTMNSGDESHTILNQLFPRDGLPAHIRALPALSSETLTVGEANVVVGNVGYRCISSHVAAYDNKPGSGAHWTDYWETSGTIEGAQWLVGSTYLDTDTIVGTAASCQVATEDNYNNQAIKGYTSFYKGNLGLESPRNVFTVSTSGIENLPPSLGTSIYGSTMCFEVADHYYFRWDKDKQQFVETALPMEHDALDSSTMPVALVYDPSTPEVFKVQPIEDYATQGRLAGDTTSVPSPRFVGYTLNDMLFHRNRLCFLSNDNIILSRSGDFFNFYGTTAAEVLDDDPIDVTPTSNRYNPLDYAVPFGNKLFLFSKYNQFVFHSGQQPLTPSTAAADITTSYIMTDNVAPVVSGASLFFLREKGSTSEMMEYFLRSDAITDVATSVSLQVPNLFTDVIKEIVTLDAYSMVFVYSKNSDIIQVYKYSWQGEKLVQSAWVTWSMPGHVKKIFVSKSKVFFVVEDNQNVMVASMATTFDTNSTPFDYALDYRIPTVVDGAHHVLIPSINLIDSTVIIDKNTGEPIDFTPLSSTLPIVQVPDDVPVNTEVVVGVKIKSSVILSELVMRDQKGLPRNDLDVTLDTLQIDYTGGLFSVNTRDSGVLKHLYVIQPGWFNSTPIGTVAPQRSRGKTKIPLWLPNTTGSIELSSEEHMITHVANITYNLEVTSNGT